MSAFLVFIAIILAGVRLTNYAYIPWPVIIGLAFLGIFFDIIMMLVFVVIAVIAFQYLRKK